MLADHANAKLIERLYAARDRSDWAGIAACFTENAIWQYPGHNPIAREYHGPTDIVALFKSIRALAGENFESNPRYILANDEVAVAYEQPTSRRRGSILSYDSLHLYHIENGKIAGAKTFRHIPSRMDAAWWY